MFLVVHLCRKSISSDTFGMDETCHFLHPQRSHRKTESTISLSTLSECPVAAARTLPFFQSQTHTVFFASSPMEASRCTRNTFKNDEYQTEQSTIRQSTLWTPSNKLWLNCIESSPVHLSQRTDTPPRVCACLSGWTPSAKHTCPKCRCRDPSLLVLWPLEPCQDA